MPDPVAPPPIKNAAPLSRLPGLTQAHIAALAAYWISSVQELQALAELAAGRSHLQSLLGLDAAGLDRLLAHAERQFGPMRDRDDKEKAAMEADYGTGALEPPAPMRAGERYDTLAVTGPLPQVVNHVDLLPPARDQGTRGTCVAHAAAAVREFLEVQAGLAQPDEIDLSEQFIYWWCKERDNLPHVSGTYPHLGLECLADAGAAPETAWPYNYRQRIGDEGQGPPPDEALQDAWRYRVKRVIRLEATAVDSIKAALADGKAVLFAIPVFDSWYRNRVTRRHGKINLPLPGERANGAHAMALIGYADDENAPGGGYFLLRNSWSPWGWESALGDGYGVIPYAFIASHNMSAVTGDRASLSDVYVRHNEEHGGQVPSSGDRFNSPDIWLRRANDGQEGHEMAQAGQPNFVYVRAWNQGPAEAKDVQATLYAAPLSTSIWPQTWQEIGVLHFSAIARGHSAVSALAWTPAEAGPFCFLARLSSPDDPVLHEWSVRNDNNLAQKNLVTLRLAAGGEGQFSFSMAGLPGQNNLMDLDVNRRAFPRGRVRLNLPQAAARSGASLIEDEGALARLAERATASRNVEVTIVADAGAQPGERGEIVFTQHSGRLLVGRVTARIEIV